MKAYLVVLFFIFLLRGFIKILSIVAMSEVEQDKEHLSSALTLVIFLTVLGAIVDTLIVISLIAAFVSQF